jgi:FkbM family methyltransferase
MRFSDRVETGRQVLNHPGNRHRRLAAIADYFRWNIGQRIMRCEHVLPLIGGARIIVSERQNYATLTYVNRLWDFADMMFLLHFLRPGDVFADLGSNVGGYTILAARAVGCHAVAFEPVPVTFAELETNIRLNDAQVLVDAHNCGLGAEPATLRMTAALGGMNHMATQGYTGQTVEVPVQRLDDALAGRAVNLIKMDAEGYERNILTGGQATLANPALHGIIVELNNSGLRYGFSDADVHAEICRFGFSPFSYDATSRVLTPLSTYNKVDFNTLYIRPSEFLTERLKSARKFEFRGLEI